MTSYDAKAQIKAGITQHLAGAITRLALDEIVNGTVDDLVNEHTDFLDDDDDWDVEDYLNDIVDEDDERGDFINPLRERLDDDNR